VSLAVVLCALASWFGARHQMISQVDQTLQQNSVQLNGGDLNLRLRQWCQENAVTGGANGRGLFGDSETTPTVIGANGQVLCPSGDARAVRPTTADVRVAASGTGGGPGGPPAESVLHDGVTSRGTAVRVYTVSLGVAQVQDADGNLVDQNIGVAFAQSLGPVQHALDMLALILLVVAALVIAGAWSAAAWVARTALKPVDRLTGAVEHIARTEEVGTTIPVEGEDEIARLSAAFNQMSTALASSRERQSQLIADAGHELRTPLTSLRTNVDLLVRSEDTGRDLPKETHSRLIRNMKAQMAELSTLIGDLLQLSRPSAERGSAPLRVIGWHELVERAVERARLRGPGITFDVDIRPWYVRADPHALERAVINLLDNAVKFSPADSAIDVRLVDGRLTVRDRGPGIPADEIPYVFERFWRSPSARQMPGSGLGLAIVAQTVRDAGGTVEMAAADPRPDGSTGGARATISLPGAPTPPPGEPGAGAGTAGPGTAGPGGSGAHAD